jgi:zinc transport system ATP-binding protein
VLSSRGCKDISLRTRSRVEPVDARATSQGQSVSASATASSESLLQADSVTVSFGGEAVLDRVSLAIGPGEVMTIVGPNGAGKTTLLRTLLGLQEPHSGRIRRRSGLRIGYMPQRVDVSANLPLTVERFLRLTAGSNAGSVRESLQETGAGHLLQRPLARVSGGELQRILLARALLANPELLVLDEPVQGVDVQGQSELYALIGQLRERRNCAVLLVSHDLHLVMAATDTVVCLNRHVCCQGHPESVSSDPAYLQLFGDRRHGALAVYAHHHDHHHDLHGDVQPPRGDDDA